MPEGPSLVILKEQLLPFVGKKIIAVSGNAKIDLPALRNKKVRTIRTWGKQLFFVLSNGSVRIHFLLFGSYSLGTQTKPDKSLRLHLQFTNGEVFFYTCSVRMLDTDIDKLFDWSADVMSDLWDPRKAKNKLKEHAGTMICDALLNQEIFSGVGNIIKNEVLYRIRLHPESLVQDIPAKKLASLVTEARNYSFDFLKWKKEFTLRKHWLAHTKKTCGRCNLPIVKKYCGKTKRRTFFCPNCQQLFG